MHRIAELPHRELKWSQPSALKREFALRAGSELMATLKFRSGWGTFATAESTDGIWTFKRVGFWQNKASVRDLGSQVDLALFKDNTWDSGGTLEFPDGHKFRATTNFWMTEFAFKTESGEPLICFKYGGVFRRFAFVEIASLGRIAPELSLLVLFGWYLVIMLDSDSSSGAEAAIVAG
jgi:hypothetical protein